MKESKKHQLTGNKEHLNSSQQEEDEVDLSPLRSKKRNFFLLNLLQLFLLFIVVFLGMVGYFQIKNQMISALVDWRYSVLSQLETQLNIRVDYDEISPSFVNCVTIKGLVITSLVTGETLLDLEKTKIYYSLFNLLKDPVNINSYISRISVLGGYVRFNYEGEMPLINSFIQLSEGGGPGEGFTFDIELNHLDVKYISIPVDIHGEDFSCSLNYTGEDYQLTANTDMYLLLHTREEYFYNFDADVKLNGTLSKYFNVLNTRAKVTNFSSDIFDLTEQNFQVYMDSKILDVQKTQDRFPVDGSFHLDIATLDMVIDGSFEDFKPEVIFSPTGKIQKFIVWTNTSVTGSGHIYLKKQEDGIYRFSYDYEGQAFIDNSFIPFPIFVDTNFEGDLYWVDFNRLYAYSSLGDLNFKGSFDYLKLYPDGIFTLSDVYTPLDKPLYANGIVHIIDDEISVQMPSLHLGEKEIKEISLDLSFKDDFSSVSFFFDSALGREYQNTSIDGFFNLDTMNLSLNTSLSDINLFWVYDLLDLQKIQSSDLAPILKDLDLYTVFSLETDFKDLFNLDCQVLNIMQASNRDNFVELNASLYSKKLDIENFNMAYGYYFSEGQAFIEISPEGALNFKSDLVVQDIPYSFQGRFDSLSEIAVTGSYGLELYANMMESFDFTVKMQNIPIPISLGWDNQFNLNVSTDLQGSSSKNGLVVRIKNSDVHLDQLGLIIDPRVGFKGLWQNNHLDLNNFNYSDSISSVTGRGSVGLSNNEEDQLLIDFWVDLLGSNGLEAYKLSGFLLEKNISAELSVTSSPFKRFLDDTLTGYLSGSLSMEGSMDSPNLRGNIFTQQAVLSGTPIEAQGALQLTESKIEISDLQLNMSNNVYTGDFLMDFTEDAFSAELDMNTNVVDPSLQTGVFIMGTLEKDISLSNLNLIADSVIEGTVFIKNIYFMNSYIRSKTIGFLRRSDIIFFDEPDTDSISGFLTTEGAFELRLRNPLPLKANVSGTISDLFEVNVNNLSLPLNELNAFLKPVDIMGDVPVFFEDGVLSGDIKITGSPSDPDFYGVLEIEEGQVSFPFIDEQFNPINTSIDIDSKMINIPSLNLDKVDGSGYIKTEGLVTLDHWGLGDFSFGLDVGGDSGIHGNFNYKGIQMDGWVHAFMDCYGNNMGMKLKGDAQIDYFAASLEQSENPSTPSYDNPTPSYEIDMDLGITIGKQVEFYIPNKNVPIITAAAERGDQLSFTYNNISEKYSLIGDLELTGQVNYFTRRFFLREGSISFNENQDKFDPFIHLKAEIRETDVEGELILIYLIADFNLSDSFSPQFESDPPLSDETIIALLGNSLLPISNENSVDLNFLSASIYASGSYANKLWIMQPVERVIRDALNFDLVSINSEVLPTLISNLLSGEDNLDSNLGDYLDNTSLMLGKYLGEDVYLDLVFSLEYQDTENIVFGGLGNLDFQSSLGLELQTPFFMIDWNLNPSHSENLFITDNTLTLSFKRSF